MIDRIANSVDPDEIWVNTVCPHLSCLKTTDHYGYLYYSEDPPLLPLMSVLPLSMTNPSDVLDMPVDPNEPTYCLCHQVSYGEMIGCDNPDVSRTNNTVNS